MKSKRNFKLATLLAFSAILSAGHAYADDPYAYTGVFIAPVEIEPANFVSAGLKAGYAFNEYFALELRGMVGVEDDSFLGIDIDLDSIIAGHMRMGGSLSETFHPYLLLGYAHTELSASLGPVNAEGSVSRLSYGAGFIADITERTGVNLEFMNYYQGSGNDEILSFTFGLVRKF